MVDVTNDSSRLVLPIWEKYALTISESALYFGIGEKKLRKIMNEHLDDGFVIQNGTKILVKRKKFEEYLDSKVTVI